jgi:hypothetical protein
MFALLGIESEGQQHHMFRLFRSSRSAGNGTVKPTALSGFGEARAEPIRHSHPLWTLRECRLELLTESEMHAFEANVKPYCPERKASNLPPCRVSRQVALCRAEGKYANIPSIFTRTLDRRAEMFQDGVAPRYRWKPLVEDSAANRLSYNYQTPLILNKGVG